MSINKFHHLSNGLTCDKVHSFHRDVHAIDSPRQGAIQLSDDRAIEHFPVSNLELENEAQGRIQLSGIIQAHASKRRFYFI